MSARRTVLALSFLTPLAAAVAWMPQGPPQAPLTPQKVAGTVHLLEGGFGGNIAAAVGPDGVVLVDDQFESQVPMIRAALEEIGGGAVRYLVNTHWHGDHTGGNAGFADEASIVAHDRVRLRLSEPQELSRGNRDAAPAAAWPRVTFEDSLTLHAGGETVRVRHYPNAHTDGDAVVWFEQSKVLHTGDLYFNGLFPFIDTETGGSVAGLLDALDAILAWLPADAVVIPGHGPLASVEDLRGYRAMLGDCADRVRAALADGRSAEDMLADGLLADYESWSWQFIDTEAFVRTLAADLGG